MKLESFDDRARSDQLLHLIVERKADQIFVLKLLLSEARRAAAVNKLVETLSPFLDVNAAIDGLTASGAVKRRGSELLVTQRGKRFMLSFDKAHERYVRDRTLWVQTDASRLLRDAALEAKPFVLPLVAWAHYVRRFERRISAGRPAQVVFQAAGEPWVYCSIGEDYVSVWVEAKVGLEWFLRDVNHIWANLPEGRPKVEKMFSGVSIETRSRFVELELVELPPPWTADAIWSAAGREVPVLVRVGTDGFDAWYQVVEARGQLTTYCGLMTHLDLYSGISTLVYHCSDKFFQREQFAAELQDAVESARGGPLRAD